jgi:hypothetical protein
MHIRSCLDIRLVVVVVLGIRVLVLAELLKVRKADVAILLPVLSDVAFTFCP